MSETNGFGVIQQDVDAIDELDDDAFLRLVGGRIEDAPENKATWRLLHHPTLIERTEGCLEEIAEELSEAVGEHGYPATHHKAKRLRLVKHRLHQLRVVAKVVQERAKGKVSAKERERQAVRMLVLRLTLAIDAHRLECIERDLTPEPHDVALWDVLDALTLPTNDDSTGPTLAEQIAAGRWQHPQAVANG